MGGKMRKAVETVLSVHKPKEDQRVWHFENPDCSPLCHRPEPVRHWLNGAPPNGYGMQTTANEKYVTCKLCRQLLSQRKVSENEIA